MERHDGWLRNVLAGFLIGAGCILPGASGGVMAVAFGLYRPMLDAVLGFLRAPKKHLLFLLPIGIGGVGGIVAGALCLSGAMARHERLMLFLFTGFILGGIPDLLQQAGSFRKRRLLSLGAGLLCALPLALLGNPDAALVCLSPAQSLLTGVLEGIGTVVPGISTSMVLIRLGWYQAYLTAVSTLAFPQLVFIVPGFALSALVCMRTVQWLFERHTGHACYAVLGFVLVSVAVVFPGFTLGLLFWAEAAMLVIGVVIVRWMGQLKQ